MTRTHTDILERSVEKAHIWLGDLAEELTVEDQGHAYRVLRAHRHALRDHLPVAESAQLAAQLPIFVRGGAYASALHPLPQHLRELLSAEPGGASAS